MKQNCGNVSETLSDQEDNLCEKTENVIQDKRKSSPTNYLYSLEEGYANYILLYKATKQAIIFIQECTDLDS